MSRALRNLMAQGGAPLETKIMVSPVPAAYALMSGARRYYDSEAYRKTTRGPRKRKPAAKKPKAAPRLGANPSLDRFNKIEARQAKPAKPRMGALRGSVFDVPLPKAPKAARGRRGR